MQAITAEQALRAVTIDAAWQLFADDRIGSIEPGKYADFTVLERNPLEPYRRKTWIRLPCWARGLAEGRLASAENVDCATQALYKDSV